LSTQLLSLQDAPSPPVLAAFLLGLAALPSVFLPMILALPWLFFSFFDGPVRQLEDNL
jgi:hypothetical protein